MSTISAKPATTVLLVRDGDDGMEVLMVVRSNGLSQRAAMSFPGGVVDASDRDEAWLPLCAGAQAVGPDERTRRIAGFRKLYQETGILPFASRPVGLSDDAAFIEVVRASGAMLDLANMAPFAHWVTPENSPKRYDTYFRLCWIDSAALAAAEAVRAGTAEWHSPREALELSEKRERYVLVPTKCQLDLLSQSPTVADAIADTQARRIVTVSPQVASEADALVLSIPVDAGYPRCEFRVDRSQL